MVKNLIKMSAMAAVVAVSLSAPAFADDTPTGVASDVGAVQKDNAAKAKDNASLAQDRAAKAKDKATGNWSGQAVDSMKVGADKVQGSEKDSETSTDKKMLNSDVNSATTK